MVSTRCLVHRCNGVRRGISRFDSVNGEHEHGTRQCQTEFIPEVTALSNSRAARGGKGGYESDAYKHQNSKNGRFRHVELDGMEQITRQVLFR